MGYEIKKRIALIQIQSYHCRAMTMHNVMTHYALKIKKYALFQNRMVADYTPSYAEQLFLVCTYVISKYRSINKQVSISKCLQNQREF